MAAKDAHEYVKVNDHPIVEDDLVQSSEQLKHAIDTSFEARQLHAEKHQKIMDAKKIIAEVLEKVSELNKMMMREKFEAHLKKSSPKAVFYREAKKRFSIKRKPQKEEKEVLVRSEKALQNLQKNLEVLKKQLY